ncbi:hypothetical protein LNP26_00410 [Klebsiella variicola subsp. variicola]|nr:hypothetical protein [Klebsiella variicola subsp. variicola]
MLLARSGLKTAAFFDTESFSRNEGRVSGDGRQQRQPPIAESGGPAQSERCGETAAGSRRALLHQAD